ncbi:hypothetical protein [Brevundimonas sp.]|uniref:hypothetical protein n=1 Tax=Brevundimonas sp. TaxID=1871086 RepID=UPI002FC87C1D
MSTHEAILKAIEALILAAPAVFPVPTIDEPEPRLWAPVAGKPMLTHAMMVMDGGPPDQLAFVRGAEDEATDELEVEVAVGYAVQAKPAAGQSMAQTRAARRAQRDDVVRAFAELIAANRNLGLGVEVWAEVAAPTRDDDIAFPNALPSATAVIPVRVLYTGTDAAA